MRALLVALLLLTAAVAGCTGSGDDDGDAGSSTSSTSRSGTATRSSTSTSAAPGNGTVRTATLSAGIANGTAPLLVNFTIDATGGARSWTLAFGDGNQTNGTTVPATTNHTYAAAGLFQANLTVAFTDGSSLARNVTVNVTAGAATASQVPFSAEGTIAFGTQGDGGCGVTGTVDIGEHAWDLGPAVIGSGVITKIVVHMDLGETNVDSDIYLLDPAGTEIGGSEDFNQPGLGTGSPTEDFEVEGPLAAGTYTFLVRGCVAVEGEYSITATADVGTA